MMFVLEKYSGPSSRHTCPGCGSKNRFTRYIEVNVGRYLAKNVGRCDREASCGYHVPPREYFAENGSGWKREKITSLSIQGRKREIVAPAQFANGTGVTRPDFIDKRHLIDSLGEYENNSFVQFLSTLFAFDSESVVAAVKEYAIGTKQGFTIFPYIDLQGRVCKGKALKFGTDGHRLKGGYSSSSFEYLLLSERKLKKDFETDKRILFGEHLLKKYPERPVAIVEAEKTAVIASVCNRAFPADFVWLAAGSLSWLNTNKLERIGRDRGIFLFPDACAFDKWSCIALEVRKRGFGVNVSDLIENLATDNQKRAGWDLADYLIEEQQRRNDSAIRASFAEMIEERLAVMTIDGGMYEGDGERYLESSGFVEYAEGCVLRMD